MFCEVESTEVSHSIVASDKEEKAKEKDEEKVTNESKKKSTSKKSKKKGNLFTYNKSRIKNLILITCTIIIESYR